MARPEFVELVGRLIEAMGQSLDSLRRSDEGIQLRTADGFVYAFLDDPTTVSLNTIERLLAEVSSTPVKLVVLTPGRLPLALSAELQKRGATLVESERFHELARSMGLGSYLGEEPVMKPEGMTARLLPSARQLDEIMTRGRTWLDWGVPALALRFYRQAAGFKPEFSPARIGIARSLAQLGLWNDSQRVYDEVLAMHPDDMEARLGRAALLGSRGRVKEEVTAYRALRAEAPERLDIRTYLIAALIDAGEWGQARKEIEGFLRQTPEDPRIRFLYSVALEKTGSKREARTERDRARRLGLEPARERTLSRHLGVPPPVFPDESPATGSRRTAGTPKRAAAGRTRRPVRTVGGPRKSSRARTRTQLPRKAK